MWYKLISILKLDVEVCLPKFGCTIKLLSNYDKDLLIWCFLK